MPLTKYFWSSIAYFAGFYIIHSNFHRNFYIVWGNVPWTFSLFHCLQTQQNCHLIPMWRSVLINIYAKNWLCKCLNGNLIIFHWCDQFTSLVYQISIISFAQWIQIHFFSDVRNTDQIFVLKKFLRNGFFLLTNRSSFVDGSKQLNTKILVYCQFINKYF